MLEETPDDGKIAQERNLRDALRVFGIDETANHHGHAGMDIDLCIGFSGKNTRYAVRINLYSRSTIQGRYFGMDFRGNLILRVDFRLDIQADTIFTPIHRYIAIAIGNRNRDTAANQDIRGFPRKRRDGGTGENPPLALVDERLERCIHARYMRAKPAATTSTRRIIFPAIENASRSYVNTTIGILRVITRTTTIRAWFL